MGCGGSCGTGGGCSSGGGCATGGCGKLNVFDWLSDMGMPLNPFDGVEVKFKGGRKEFYRNVNNVEIHVGDLVVVDAGGGHHIGSVSASGEIVRLQMKRRKVELNDDLKVIYRIATDRDKEKFEQARNRELPTLFRGRTIIQEHKLDMKLSDVEYQADNTKATFFYSAEERVDFRELIKALATEFRIKVEMRQISLRQEAGRLGGVGSCGRELCCSTWLTDFKSVSTSAARYQNLSLNPAKLSGQCGRLKCCLNYELDTYMSALRDIPNVEKPLKIQSGEARLQKTDIFKRRMWFAFNSDTNWYPVEIDRVNEIIAMNKEGKMPYSLTENLAPDEVPIEVINKDLAMLDKKYAPVKNTKKKKKKPQAGGQPTTNAQPKQN